MPKKPIALLSVLVLAMVLAMPGNIKAQTAADIQNQINQLLAQVTQLENQLAQINNQQTPYYQNQNIPAGFTFTQDLSLGTVSQDVIYLRSVLIQDGCLNSAYGTSQYFDSVVSQAVACFQSKHNPDIFALVGYRVFVTGNVGPGTRAELNNLIGSNYVYNNNNSYSYPYTVNYSSYSSPLSVSCYASPNSINTNQSASFTASATGGAGYYNYTWSGACVGSGSTCSTPPFTSAGNYTAYVTVTSNGQTASANCPVGVNSIYNYYNNYNNYQGNLTASCYASPSSVQAGQSVDFIGTASGGSGIYTYSWSGACTGGSSNCYNTFSNTGTYTAYLTVTSGGQTVSVNCPATISGYYNYYNNYYNNSLSISCITSPSPVRVNVPVAFTVALPVGANAYTYSWTGSCIGSSPVCYSTFPAIGNYNSTVIVYSNGVQIGTANCSASVNSY